MNKCIIFFEEGLLRILVPIENEDQSLRQIIEADVPNDLEYRIVDADALPEDRTFRNAWTIDLQVNMGKAREIWLAKIRRARNKALIDLDVKFMRALEADDKRDLQDISNQKHTLRVLPKMVDLDLYTNAKSLRAFWPKELKGYE